MESQNYKNHVRYYAPHHFVFYPVLMVMMGFSISYAFKRTDESLIWMFIAFSFFMIGWLSFLLRQHYALNNQNRIVRLEMRFRYYVLTNERLEKLEDGLSFGQISALRFASDEELSALVNRALVENLSPDAIKKAVNHWNADHMRV